MVSIGDPSITFSGSAWFAGVWFRFSAGDAANLHGQGTLVWSKSIDYEVHPCNTTILTFMDQSSMWFRKSFTLDASGGLIDGDLTDNDMTPSEAGLALDVATYSISALVEGHPQGNHDWSSAIENNGGSSGSFSSRVSWAILPGNLAGGSGDGISENYWGYDYRIAHAAIPPNAWSSWGQALGHGSLAVQANWNQCVCRPTKEMTATSSQPVQNGGPSRAHKRDQAGVDVQWTTE